MSSMNSTWRIVFKIARWVLLMALLIMLLPIALFLVIGVFILVPKGRVWGTFWGSALGNAATGLWHKVFGAPLVRIDRPHFRRDVGRRGRFNNYRN